MGVSGLNKRQSLSLKFGWGKPEWDLSHLMRREIKIGI